LISFNGRFVEGFVETVVASDSIDGYAFRDRFKNALLSWEQMAKRQAIKDHVFRFGATKDF